MLAYVKGGEEDDELTLLAYIDSQRPNNEIKSTSDNIVDVAYAKKKLKYFKFGVLQVIKKKYYFLFT